MEAKNYLMPEFEERLRKAKGLKRKIDNPEPDRLLSAHHQLKKEYASMLDDKTLLYLAAKKAIEEGFKLFAITDKNEIGYVRSYSMADHPQVCYAGKSGFTLPIVTSRRRPFTELSPSEFMKKLMNGDYSTIRTELRYS